MGGENGDPPVLQGPEQVLHLLGHHHIQGGQRLVQEQDVRLRDDVDQHLHLVLHAVGIVLQQLVPVLWSDAHFLKIRVQRPGIPDGVGIDVHEELEELPAGEELRHRGRGEDIPNVLCCHFPAHAVLLYGKAAAVGLDVPVQAVEERRLTGAVSAQQAVDPPLLKRKVDVLQNLFMLKALGEVLDDKLHGLLLTVDFVPAAAH